MKKFGKSKIYRFCFLIFIGLALLIMSACRGDKDTQFLPPVKVTTKFDAEAKAPLVEFIINPKNYNSTQCNEQLRKTIDYAKIPYKSIQLNSFNKNQAISNSTKVLGIYNVAVLNKKSIKALLEFVTNGGTLFIATVSENTTYGFFAGAKPNANYYTDVSAKGYRFTKNIVPGIKGKTYRNHTKHYGLKKENFSPRVEFWASASNNPEVPIILKNKIGKGQVISLNTSIAPEKPDRGIFFSAVLSGLPNLPYPIVNVSSIFLDDFPSPVYDAVKEPIKSEMQLNQTQFYSKVWWPDMLQLAKQENLEYTAMLCFDYSNETHPPFLFSEWKAAQIKLNGKQQIASNWLLQQVRKNNFELGFHGYNHISLKDRNWFNKDYMVLSLKAAGKFWKSNSFGNYPVTYVPPSNQIDSVGISALKKGMPSIRYLSSRLMGKAENGGDREFDTDPYNAALFDFPRITSGYLPNDRKEFDQQSFFLYTGIWTHHLNPNGVYNLAEDQQTNPNSIGWKTAPNGSSGIFPKFKQHIKKTKELFPFIRFYKVKKAGPLVENWRNEAYNRQEKKGLNTVSLKNSVKKNKPTFWFAYVENKDKTRVESYLNSKNHRFSKTALLNGDLYMIKTNAPNLSLPKPLDLSLEKEELLTEVYKNYEDFLANKMSFKNKEEQLAYEIEQGNFTEAIVLLKSKVRQSKKIEKSHWKKLFTYLSWKNREIEIWNLLEEKYQDIKNPLLANLAKDFVSNSDYPNKETRKRWMQRQLEQNPENTKLKIDYIFVFGKNEAISFSQKEVLELLSTSESSTKKEFALDYLLNNYPNKGKEILEKKAACKDPTYVKIAARIAYFYADNDNFEKALAWANCAKKLPKEATAIWEANLGHYDKLKTISYSKYLGYLLEKQPKKATAELIEKTPCADSSLQKHTKAIAYAFANQGSFRKALAWANCESTFPAKEKMQWQYELGLLAEVEKTYKKQASKTDRLKTYMSEVYAAEGKIKQAWQLAASLKASAKKDSLQAQLNKDVVYLKAADQQQLLEENPDFFYPDVAKKIRQDLRLEQNDFIVYQGNLITDKFDPTSLGNKVAYGFRDKKLNTHSFGVTQYNAYALEVASEKNNPNNIDHNLYGVEYAFKSKEKSGKLNYSARARIELSKNDELYYHVAVSASFSKGKLYSGLKISMQPAITGPAYSLDIYRLQLSLYEELKFSKKFSTVLGIEGNYYTDEVLDGLALSRFIMTNKLSASASLNPYTEIAGRLGSENRKDGFPYWTIDKRLYGGLGVAFNYKNENSKFNFTLDAAVFLDSYSDSFERFKGQVSYPFFSRLYISGKAEFFTLKNFYSNNFGMGLKYYF